MQERVLICLPMKGQPPEAIEARIARAREKLERRGYEVADTYAREEWKEWIEKERYNKRLFFLSRSLEEMSQCDAVYFCRGWQDAIGCYIEHMAAANYGLVMLYEDDEQED